MIDEWFGASYNANASGAFFKYVLFVVAQLPRRKGIRLAWHIVLSVERPSNWSSEVTLHLKH